MSSAIISRQTADALERVMAFFGIDDYNRSLFGEAAADAGVEPFSATIGALDAAIQRDKRNAMTRRIRDRIERQRVLDKQRVKP